MKDKILFLSPRLGYNSLLYWDILLTGIKKKFCNFRVFTSWAPLETKDGGLKTENKIQALKIYVRQGSIDQRLFFLPSPYLLLELIKIDPKIIIINEFSLVSLYVVILKILKKNKILLLVESDPYRGLSDNRDSFLRKKVRLFILRQVDLILTNNELGKKYLYSYRDSNIIKKVEIKPYLTSCIKYSKKIKKSSSKNKILKLLFVGQIIERKGLKYFFKALLRLDKKYIKSIKVDIIGDGNLLEEYKKHIAQNKILNKIVIFHGNIKFENLSDYYMKSDCFISPTLHDYRALVGFEALSAGLPIIASKYDGSRFEIVKEGENGFIIDPKKPNEIADSIQKLIDNEKLLSRFGEESKRMAENYSEKSCISNITGSINKLLNK